MFWNKKHNTYINFFVSIGAGLNQIPLIREAKKHGFHVIGVDTNPLAPGFMHCDLKIQESIENHEDIYKKLIETLFDGRIAGVMTKSYGIAIHSTAFLAERFNVPYIPLSRSEYFINKKLMKDLFLQNNIRTPEIFALPSKNRIEKIDKKAFPIIKKPVIGHAKVGVHFLKNAADLKKHWPETQEKETVLFEKFINGDEIIAAGIVHKQKFHLVDITDKETTELPHFVDIMHMSPSRYYHLFDEIASIGQSVADAFNIANSPLIMEFVLDDDGRPCLIEAVPEFGGEFLTDVVIPARTGYNFIGEAIKANTDTGFKPPLRKKARNAVVVKYITGTGGTLLSFNPDGPKKMRNVIFSRIFKEIGAGVNRPETNLDRLGVIITRDKNPETALAAAEQAAESLQIRIKK